MRCTRSRSARPHCAERLESSSRSVDIDREHVEDRRDAFTKERVHVAGSTNVFSDLDPVVDTARETAALRCSATRSDLGDVPRTRLSTRFAVQPRSRCRSRTTTSREVAPMRSTSQARMPSSSFSEWTRTSASRKAASPLKGAAMRGYAARSNAPPIHSRSTSISRSWWSHVHHHSGSVRTTRSRTPRGTRVKRPIARSVWGRQRALGGSATTM